MRQLAEESFEGMAILDIEVLVGMVLCAYKTLVEAHNRRHKRQASYLHFSQFHTLMASLK